MTQAADRFATLPAKTRAAWLASAALLLALAILDFATLPPPLPPFAAVRAAWGPSEAWLYDRHGTFIASARIDFAARRLAWTPLARVSPAAREALVAAEDKRFWSHGGVDWIAFAATARDWLERRRARAGAPWRCRWQRSYRPRSPAPARAAGATS